MMKNQNQMQRFNLPVVTGMRKVSGARVRSVTVRRGAWITRDGWELDGLDAFSAILTCESGQETELYQGSAPADAIAHAMVFCDLFHAAYAGPWAVSEPEFRRAVKALVKAPKAAWLIRRYHDLKLEADAERAVDDLMTGLAEGAEDQVGRKRFMTPRTQRVLKAFCSSDVARRLAA